MKQKGTTALEMRWRNMKTNNSPSVTATLNANDLMELYENGELSDNGIVIGTTEPELERFREMVENRKS